MYIFLPEKYVHKVKLSVNLPLEAFCLNLFISLHAEENCVEVVV